MSANLTQLPPSPFVRNAEGLLSEYSREAGILDIGCGEGRNAQYLADLGHQVVGLSLEREELLTARSMALEVSYPLVQGDMRKLMFRKQFGAVIINEVLHQVSKDEASEVLNQARSLTVKNGLNVISGYLTDAGNNPQNRYFYPGELEQIYQHSGWKVLSYEEDWKAPTIFQGKELINSQAMIVARR
jgi:tellurite methyltransferase